MKIINVKNFAFKGSSANDKVYFVEGLDDYMVLIYNPKFSTFMFAPVKYDGNKTNLNGVIEEVNDKLSLISKLKTKLANHSNILEVNLGGAEFHLTHYFKSDFERDLYLTELKKAKLIPHERYPDEINHILSGFVEYEDDIILFVNNIRNLDVQKLKIQQQNELSMADRKILERPTEDDVTHPPIKGKIKNLNPLKDTPEDDTYVL